MTAGAIGEEQAITLPDRHNLTNWQCIVHDARVLSVRGFLQKLIARSTPHASPDFPSAQLFAFAFSRWGILDAVGDTAISHAVSGGCLGHVEITLLRNFDPENWIENSGSVRRRTGYAAALFVMCDMIITVSRESVHLICLIYEDRPVCVNADTRRWYFLVLEGYSIRSRKLFLTRAAHLSHTRSVSRMCYHRTASDWDRCKAQNMPTFWFASRNAGLGLVITVKSKHKPEKSYSTRTQLWQAKKLTLVNSPQIAEGFPPGRFKLSLLVGAASKDEWLVVQQHSVAAQWLLGTAHRRSDT
ncbi:hypothetical protein C8R44DRAFT_750380 [Mycena epipterygia]|nr:hypothetical protein C8R44DRAFT_750380 [Mycena epipterygia]